MGLVTNVNLCRKSLPVQNAYITLDDIFYSRQNKQVHVSVRIYTNRDVSLADPDSFLYRQQFSFELAELEADFSLNLHKGVYQRLKTMSFEDDHARIDFNEAVDVLESPIGNNNDLSGQ